MREYRLEDKFERSANFLLTRRVCGCHFDKSDVMLLFQKRRYPISVDLSLEIRLASKYDGR